MAHDLERKDVFTVEFILSLIPRPSERGRRKSLRGIKVSLGKKKLRLFKQTEPLVCKHCGLEALYFALEKHKKVEKGGWHLNLYGMRDKKEIMLTVDHIVPKAKGGTNDLSNLQVLCEPCNVAKADKDPHGECSQRTQTSRRTHGTAQTGEGASCQTVSGSE